MNKNEELVGYAPFLLLCASRTDHIYEHDHYTLSAQTQKKCGHI